MEYPRILVLRRVQTRINNSQLSMIEVQPMANAPGWSVMGGVGMGGADIKRTAFPSGNAEQKEFHLG
ncbi:hypothetical protein D3C85_509250 [compost metagenome]